MKIKWIKPIALVAAGLWFAATTAMAVVLDTSDDFATDTTASWSSVGPTNTLLNYDGATEDYDDGDPSQKLGYVIGMTLTGDGLYGEGGLRLDSQNDLPGDEAVGMTIDGTMEEGETIVFTGSVYNDFLSATTYKAQLWNLTDDVLLRSSRGIIVEGSSHIAYVPVDFSVTYVATTNDVGDTLQIRIAEEANNIVRDVFLDNFTVDSTAPGVGPGPTPGVETLFWDFELDDHPIAEDIAEYDYTSDQVYVGSNAVVNTLAINGNSGGSDYWLAGKGPGHENCMFSRTLNLHQINAGFYIQKLDFTLDDYNSTNAVRVSWSFDILGSASGFIIPTDWEIHVNYANNSPNLGVSGSWFTSSNSVLAQTFDFNDTDLNSDWTTVTGYYDIPVNKGGTLGGIQIRQPFGVGGYTGVDGIYLDNIEITIEVGPLTYTTWAAEYDLTTSPDADPEYDYDIDAISNLGEYGLGGDPTNSADRGHAPLSFVQTDGGTNWLYYVYPQRSDPAAAGLDYYLETNDDLSTPSAWTNAGYEVLGTAPAGYAPGFDAVTNRISTTGESEQYIKLNIELL